MASSRLLLAVAGLLLLATVAMLSARRQNSGAPTVLWTEDTELDKMTMVC
jgi:hypothetical protein